MSDGAVTSSRTCACGNPASTTCVECRDPSCGLCARGGAKGDVCLACRSSALKLDDERAARARMGRTGPRRASFRVRKTWVLLPATVALLLAIMTSVVGTVLSEAGGARAERHAKDALFRIVEAEERVHAKDANGYAPLEALTRAGLALSPIPGYAIRVDVAKDGHTFWARAVPEREGLRSMIIDARGVIVYDGGSE